MFHHIFIQLFARVRFFVRWRLCFIYFMWLIDLFVLWNIKSKRALINQPRMSFSELTCVPEWRVIEMFLYHTRRTENRILSYVCNTRCITSVAPYDICIQWHLSIMHISVESRVAAPELNTLSYAGSCYSRARSVLAFVTWKVNNLHRTSNNTLLKSHRLFGGLHGLLLRIKRFRPTWAEKHNMPWRKRSLLGAFTESESWFEGINNVHVFEFP